MKDVKNGLKQYKIPFEELQITPESLLNILGYNMNDPGYMLDIAHGILAEAPRKTRVHGGYSIVKNVAIGESKEYITIDGNKFHTNKIITNQLKKAEDLAIFICTAGPGLETWSKALLNGDDPARGFMIDTLASMVVDAGMDIIHDDLENRCSANKQAVTNRFSPGYCGWPLKDNQLLFSFFPTGFCGIHLNESSFMTPVKSISGIIGIGKEVNRKAYQCELCDKEDCVYRNRFRG